MFFYEFQNYAFNSRRQNPKCNVQQVILKFTQIQYIFGRLNLVLSTGKNKVYIQYHPLISVNGKRSLIIGFIMC